jgi:hypothetical protein
MPEPGPRNAAAKLAAGVERPGRRVAARVLDSQEPLAVRDADELRPAACVVTTQPHFAEAFLSGGGTGK